MKYSLKLTDLNDSIKKEILNAMKQHLHKVFIKAVASLSNTIKPLIINALKQEPEYGSLMRGRLRLELGIPDTSNVDKVIEQLANTLNISYSPIQLTSNALSGNIKITLMQSSDLGGVIYEDIAMVTDEKNGYSLPWLEWLLLKGNSPIIKGYSVKFGNNSNSRTGDAIMISSNSSWRVPTEFVGSQTDNWTTRALAQIEDKIMNLIQSSIEDNI